MTTDPQSTLHPLLGRTSLAVLLALACPGLSAGCSDDDGGGTETQPAPVTGGSTDGGTAPTTDASADAPEGAGEAQGSPASNDTAGASDAGGSDGTATATAPSCIPAPRNECNPDPPDNDPVGQVCHGDGTAEEAYCYYDGSGQMRCGRAETGGPCGSAPGSPDGTTGAEGGSADGALTSDGVLTLGPVPAGDALGAFFSKQIEVFGVRLVATASVPDAKLRHAAAIMAEYLDNDEDGNADDPAVVQSMQRNNALLVMFGSSNELESSGLFESSAIDGYWGQDLQADETAQPGRFDAALEEVLHLISTAGYARVYPEAFDESAGSLLTAAMDLARGGRFPSVPGSYPEAAWYHYDDRTCDYRCMAVEYFYWALTTLLGGQGDPERCAEIRIEWEPCTPEALRSTDAAAHTLLTDPQYKLPTRLPDGDYSPGGP